MNEADEEHHVAKLLIAELDAMDGSESHFDAKFQVLAENVRHHIEEEEGEMLPKAQKVIDNKPALARDRCTLGNGVDQPLRLANVPSVALVHEALVDQVEVNQILAHRDAQSFPTTPPAPAGS